MHGAVFNAEAREKGVGMPLTLAFVAGQRILPDRTHRLRRQHCSQRLRTAIWNGDASDHESPVALSVPAKKNERRTGVGTYRITRCLSSSHQTSSKMPERQAAIDISSLHFVGSELQRPECVLATESGDLFTCDRRGVIARLHSSGETSIYGSEDGTREHMKSNGFALLPDRSFLFANLGEGGGVWSIDAAGQLRPFLQEVDGERVPSTNFVHSDSLGRVWVCVSTRSATSHRFDHRLSSTQDDGYIVLVDGKGPRIVADGLVWTNECRVSPSGSHLYVNETMARRLTRFAIGEDGSLSARQTIAAFEDGTWPDGLAFDAEDGVWITSPISNRVIRVSPDGEQHLILEDCDHRHVQNAERAFLAGELTREAIYNSPSKTLKHLSSLAFGGPDLRTVFLGSLGGASIPYFRSEIAGHPMSHWKARF